MLNLLQHQKGVVDFVAKPKQGVDFVANMYFKTRIFTFNYVNFILGTYSLV